MAVAGALLALAVGAPAASAVVVPKAGGGFVGVQPRPGTAAAAPSAAPQNHKVAPQPQLTNGNGQVMMRTTVHTIFWDPDGAMSAAFKGQITGYVAAAAADSGKRSNLYSVLTQYTNATGGHIAYDVTDGGSVTDTHAYPAIVPGSGCDDPNAGTVCLEDSQLQHEIDVVRKAHGWPADSPTALQDIYMLITPAGVDSCDGGSPEGCTFSASNGYCAYHSAFASGAQRVVYANVPVIAGCDSGQTPSGAPDADADGVLDSLSHEHMEAITDPNGDAWTDSGGQEIADKCTNPVVSSTADVYGDPLGGLPAPHTLFNEVLDGRAIYVQKEWSNAQKDCLQRMGPTPAFTPPAGAATGAPTAFAGSATDPDGTVQTWTWDFGDGTAPVTGQNPSHQFAAPGTYTVRLTAADASGSASATTVEHPVVVAAGPTAAFGVPAHAAAGSPVPFDGSGSSPSPGSTITSYSWNFGDGATGTGAKPSHAYAHAGNYTVQLTVTDAAGHHGVISHVLSVVGPPAAAFTAPASAVAGSDVAFDGSSSSDPNGAITGYAWSFGDGTTGTGATVTHAFATAGDYVVTLKVTDVAGATAQTTRTVTVTAPASPPATPTGGDSAGASGAGGSPAPAPAPAPLPAPQPLEPASLRVGGDPLAFAVTRDRSGHDHVRTGPTLSCVGSTGSCRVTSTLYVTRRVRRHGRLVAQRVAIGHVTQTLDAGSAVAHVTITLSADGARLLAHAPGGRLHVTLVVTGAAEPVTRTGTLRRPAAHRA